MHRQAVRELIKRARRDSELVDEVLVSIDITKSNPYRTKQILESDEDGTVTNRWLLGYKDEADESTDFYFQWASIQIVGFDIPLVLDVLPVRRGMSRAEIVESLLKHAAEVVDIELVMMDREFDTDTVKEVCEEHDVYYLYPSRMYTSDRATCTRLRRQGKRIHIEADDPTRDQTVNASGRTTLDQFLDTQGSTTETDQKNDPVRERKRVFVPAINAELTSDKLTDEDQEAEPVQEPEIRQELIEEFADTTNEEPDRGERMFGELIEEIREDEAQRELPGNERDSQLYMLFETNHPRITLPDDDEEVSEPDKAHMVGRMVRQYKHRWGIENGFKQIKSFRVRTTSMNHEYRFFNFLFACTLYNVWRLTDLLVKLELQAESGIEYKPLVSADLFLTIAKEYVGLDPPD